MIDEKSWVAKVRDAVEHYEPWAEVSYLMQRSIYEVPAFIKGLNSKAYEPQVVSFGPRHHGNQNLQQMEKHKFRSLTHLLKRAEKPVEEFLRGMVEIKHELLSSYQDLNECDYTEFLQLMVVDGCFMLEVVRAAATDFTTNEYPFNDPIFSSHGMIYVMPYIKKDMLMLENQLPLVALKKIVSIESSYGPRDAKFGEGQDAESITQLVLKFCSPDALPLPQGDRWLGLHPLDLTRRSMLSQSDLVSMGSLRLRRKSEPGDIFGSAVELDEFGIGVKKSKTKSVTDVCFQAKNGELSLPVMVVDDATECLLLNLMAFERLHADAGNEITSYVSFMCRMIRSARDVKLLRLKGIIENKTGSDEITAKLFSNVSKFAVLDLVSSHEEVRVQVKLYCRKRCNIWWSKWWVDLRRNHFSSPWTFISLIAAVILLLLTTLQTWYTVYAYHHPPS